MTPSSSLFPLWPRPSLELDKCPTLSPKGCRGHLLQPFPFRGEEIRQNLQQLPLVLKLCGQWNHVHHSEGMRSTTR